MNAGTSANAAIDVIDVFGIAQAINAAKSINDYIAANKLFAALIFAYDEDVQRDVNANIAVFVETDDEYGDSLFKAYYDLLVLDVVKSDGSTETVNIPVPLLTSRALIVMLKVEHEFVERLEHNREYLKDQEKIASAREFVDRMLAYVDEVIDPPYASILCDYEEE